MNHIKHHILRADTEPEIKAFGLLCPVAPSRMAWEINRLTEWELERRPDLSSGASYFACFGAYLKDEECEIVLIRNKGTNAYLLPNLRQLDYLLFEYAALGTFLTPTVDFRQSKWVQYCSEFNPNPGFITELGVFDL